MAIAETHRRIILPVRALLEQFKSNTNHVIRQLDISFIQHSLDRVNVEERLALIPIVLPGCSSRKGQTGEASIFSIILRLLFELQIPPRGSKEDAGLRSSLGLSDDADAEYLANGLGLFLRLRAPTGVQTVYQSNPTLSQEDAALFAFDNSETHKIFSRLSDMRSKMITFLASGAFTDQERFLPAIVAASGLDNRAAAAAEEILKRTTVSLEDESIVKTLFQAHSNLPAANRARILGMLAKSAVSTTMSNQILSAIELDLMPSSDQGSDSPLRPSSALVRTKLHRALFQYLSWVAQIGPTRPDFNIGATLIRHMKAYIESQGWPVPLQTSQDDTSLRCRAYETIGSLARSANLPPEELVSLAAWLFQSLAEDPTDDAVVNIDGTLSMLSAAVPPSLGGSDEALAPMLLKYMSQPLAPPIIRSTRHAAVKWANQCLPFSDIRARWIDILAIAGRPNERGDVVELGHQGLDPWTFYSRHKMESSLPDWKAMAITFFDTEIEPAQTSDPQQQKAIDPMPKRPVFQNFHFGRMHAFPVALRYCKHMMVLSALGSSAIQADRIQTLDLQVKGDLESRDKIRAYLRANDSAYVVFFLKCCLEGAFLNDSPIVEECIRCFVDIASLTPGGPLGYLVETNSSLRQLLTSNNRDIRRLGAKAMGILAAHPANSIASVNSWCSQLQSMWANVEALVGSDVNAAEGAFLALGYLLSRCVFYGREFSSLEYPFEFLTDHESASTSFRESVLESFSQLWSVGIAVPTQAGKITVQRVMERLSSESRKGSEKAIIALGSLAMGLEAFDSDASFAIDNAGLSQGSVGSILSHLFSLHDLKQAEIQFTIGEAIVAAVARWDSTSLKLTMDVETRDLNTLAGSRGALLDAIMAKVLEGCKATKPSLLKASGIWLFCIVQYCSHLPQVQSRLREVQAAFMRLLNSRDELVQESASRGLSLVYERGDPELKSALVKDLVTAFTGSQTQIKVDEETELFEPGALPTGQGNSVTSYKDIVSLANEVGDQRLVYKFMSLAANAVAWSTRSAFGRFGLSNILSESDVDPKLYPKLYRYRFDPNANVQRSMNDIWKALVKDPSKTIDAHFDAIMEDLLKSIMGREWRMREASCAAISDLIQGRKFSQYENYYSDIWSVAVKVLDDVKGSVREAALRLCMTLSNILVRQLRDGSHSAATRAMMREALHFLLSDKGVESSVEEVRVFATLTVIKIAKHGGKSLEPVIADVVPRLLGLLSTIEPEQINYHYQRAGGDSRDKIDRLRSRMVNQSPISEAIEDCLRFVNAGVMADLAPRLEATIKGSIGMPTKIGCTRVLTTLATRHADVMRPMSSRFLRLVEKQILDKNDEVSQAYARASAYLLRVVSESTQTAFCQKLIDTYAQAEDEGGRQKVADVTLAVAKVSPDQFTSNETTLLPFAYFGSHDGDEYTAKILGEVWNQHAGSSLTVVRFVPEIVALVKRCLGTSQWALRHTAALAVASMASDVAGVSDATNAMGEGNFKTIWPVLEETLSLKTFSGKEKVLESFAKFVEQGKAFWKSNEAIAIRMKEIALREVRRNNDDYRIGAFGFIWKFAKARDDLDMLEEILDLVKPHLDSLKDEDKMELDEEDGTREKVALQTAQSGLEAVVRGYSRPRARSDFSTVARTIVEGLQPYTSSTKFESIKREVWYDGVRDLMEDGVEATTATLKGHDAGLGQDDSRTLACYLESLDVARAGEGSEKQRLKRTSAVLATLRAARRRALGKTTLEASLEESMRSAMKEERSLEVQRGWREVVEEVEGARQGGYL